MVRRVLCLREALHVKVIFLDLDGVLNNSASVLAKIGKSVMSMRQRSCYKILCNHYRVDDEELPYGPEFAIMTNDPVAVGLLNRCLRETEAKIVVSSSHRNNFTRYDKGLMHGSMDHLTILRIFFGALGVLEEPIIDVTQSYDGKTRGQEVQNWLDAHSEVESYVILDDGKDFFGHQHHVWCDPKFGFHHKEFVEACLQLGSKQGMILTLEETE